MITLNLISPEQKKLLKTKQIYLLFKNLCSLILVFIIIVSIVLMFSFNSLEVLYGLNPGTQNSMGLDEKEVQAINNQLNNIVQIQNQFIVWSDALIDITNLIPEGIEVDNLEINKITNNVKIDGFAKTRDEYLNLINSLKSNENLTKLKSPLENILSKEDITFSISFTYKLNSKD